MISDGCTCSKSAANTLLQVETLISDASGKPEAFSAPPSAGLAMLEAQIYGW
jgi:hypothetical protein